MVSISSKLHSATAREAAADAVARCLTGIDIADEALFRSAFTDDAVFDLSGNVLKGIDKIISDCYNNVSKLDTTHFTSNQRIQVSSDETKAELTCSGLAQHFTAGTGLDQESTNFLAGHLHQFELVKDESDGLFKIKTWIMKIVWGRGELVLGTME